MLTVPSGAIETKIFGLSCRPFGMPSPPYFCGSSAAMAEPGQADAEHQAGERSGLQKGAPAGAGVPSAVMRVRRSIMLLPSCPPRP